MEIRWEDGFTIRVRSGDGEVVLSANRAGLLSLANQLRALAGAPAGSHIHYDTYNSLEEGSAQLIVERTD